MTAHHLLAQLYEYFLILFNDFSEVLFNEQILRTTKDREATRQVAKQKENRINGVLTSACKLIAQPSHPPTTTTQ